MNKLNRKGYITIEIIIASVIAFSIAFFLMEITMKLVDVTDNEYVDTNFMTDKALIMNNIRKNLKKDIVEYEKIDSINCNNNYCEIYFESSGGPTEARRIVIDKENNTIKYTDNLDNGTVIYSNKLDSGVKINSLTGGISGSYAYFQIGCQNIFSDEDYDISIVIFNIKQFQKYEVKLDISGYYGNISTTVKFDNTDYGPSLDVYSNWEQTFYSGKSDTYLECYEDENKKNKYDFETKNTMRYQGYTIDFTTGIPNKLYCNFSEVYE